ncbi:Surfeit locus protein 1 [Cryptotermes secundus]|uniref:SURF1-like protein n=1 Tax=Cryptotermes secundus TaxID=105785 RepID=A0A2J7RIZ6_9NEOP|nr:Surfeit locus protein 1 [Cryptotermes secundus]
MIKSKRMRWAGHVTRMEKTRNAYRILVGKPEGKRPLGRPRRRWVDNIKMDLREIGWDGMDWIDLAKDRDQWRALVNTAMNLRLRMLIIKEEDVTRVFLGQCHSSGSQLPTVAAVVLSQLIPTTTFGLGTWQVQRRKWKRQLIADLKTRTNAAPRDLPLDLEELSQLEYCPVRVQGQFEHSRELYIGPRTLIADGDAASQSSLTTHKSGVQSGYLVVTPFHLSDRDMTILVNRGWVPANHKNPNTRKAGQVEGEVEIVGVVRLTEKRAPFMPKNQPHAWFYRDLPKMAEAAGTEPVFLEAKAETTVPGGPIGGQTRVSLRDEHLSYLLTWLVHKPSLLCYLKFYYL